MGSTQQRRLPSAPEEAMLPPMTVDMVLRIRDMTEERAERGWRWCHKSGIGKLRRDFGFLAGPVAISGIARLEQISSPPDTRMAIRVLGVALCADCPFRDCPLNGE